MKINTEDYGSILLEFDSGAHGSLTVNQCAAGRKNRLYLEIDGEKMCVSWNQERPNELWVGRRDGPNQTVLKDPSLLYPAAREYAHYPGGHNEGYPDGPKNLFRNVYGFIAGTRRAAISRRSSMATTRSRSAMRRLRVRASGGGWMWNTETARVVD